ncbi:MAG: hemolysin family protein [Anaerovoracaceae bacterium]|jgi:putative hemolysin
MDANPQGGLLILIEVIFIVVSLIISGFLSAADTAMTTVNRNHMRAMADGGDSRAGRVVKIFDAPGKFFSVSLIVTIFLGFLSIGSTTKTFGVLLGKYFTEMGLPYGGALAVLALTVVISTLFLIFGFLYPKQVALQHTESVALALSGYALFFSRICTPFVAVCNGLTNLFLKITGQETGIRDAFFSEEEIMSMLEVGQEEGVLKEEGKKMIDSIFAFDDKLAYEVMTPRTDVFSIDIDDEPEEYLDQLMEMRYSRIPVYEEDSDNIIGILNIKDFLIKARENGFDGVVLRDILRAPFFVPETKNIDSLFFELQKKKQHIAILIDEYGGFSGIVTMEDMVEEIMGNIDDEYDEEEPTIEQLGENLYHIDGTMDLDDINDELGTHLFSDNSETLGGLLIEILGEIPDEDGEEKQVVELGNITFTIESVMDRRIAKVKMEVSDISEEGEEEGEKQDREGTEKTE